MKINTFSAEIKVAAMTRLLKGKSITKRHVWCKQCGGINTCFYSSREKSACGVCRNLNGHTCRNPRCDDGRAVHVYKK